MSRPQEKRGSIEQRDQPIPHLLWARTWQNEGEFNSLLEIAFRHS
jgi:hypothetical protein